VEYETKNMSIIYVETLNIEWDRIDPKGNRRVKKQADDAILHLREEGGDGDPLALVDVVQGGAQRLHDGGQPRTSMLCHRPAHKTTHSNTQASREEGVHDSERKQRRSHIFIVDRMDDLLYYIMFRIYPFKEWI